MFSVWQSNAYSTPGVGRENIGNCFNDVVFICLKQFNYPEINRSEENSSVLIQIDLGAHVDALLSRKYMNMESGLHTTRNEAK